MKKQMLREMGLGRAYNPHPAKGTTPRLGGKLACGVPNRAIDQPPVLDHRYRLEQSFAIHPGQHQREFR